MVSRTHLGLCHILENIHLPNFKDLKGWCICHREQENALDWNHDVAWTWRNQINRLWLCWKKGPSSNAEIDSCYQKMSAQGLCLCGIRRDRHCPPLTIFGDKLGGDSCLKCGKNRAVITCHDVTRASCRGGKAFLSRERETLLVKPRMANP